MTPGLLSRWCSAPYDRQRWVVLDVETTGLDVRQDQVLSVAALGLHWRQSGAELVVADAFEADLRPHAARADHDNILLHGIGLGRQQQGGAPAQVLQALQAWLGHAPVVAFHAPFDRQFLARACKAAGVTPLTRHWLDLAELAPAAKPALAARSLDDWLAVWGIVCRRRHCAAADVWATAQLLLAVLAALPPDKRANWAHLVRLANSNRWLPRR